MVVAGDLGRRRSPGGEYRAVLAVTTASSGCRAVRYSDSARQTVTEYASAGDGSAVERLGRSRRLVHLGAECGLLGRTQARRVCSGCRPETAPSGVRRQVLVSAR